VGLLDVVRSAYAGAGPGRAQEWLSSQLGSKADLDRREDAKLVDRCYRNNADRDMRKFIAKVMSRENTATRSQFVEVAKHTNVVRRIAQEKATVYNQHVFREIPTKDEEQAKLSDFCELSSFDLVMQELDRMLVVHDSMLVQYRVRINMSGDREPCIDLVHPGMFIALHHPVDETLLVGIAMEAATDGEWFVDFGDEYMTVRSDGTVIPGSLKKRSVRPNWFIAHQTPPTTRGCILARNPSGDMVAAHMAVWFENISMIKESKSSTIIPTLTGDTSRMPMGQVADSERFVMLGDGVTPSTLDLTVDLNAFQQAADHILERSAANHGVPPSVMFGRDAASGMQMHMMRLPLIELRRRRVSPLLKVERQLWQIISTVNQQDLPDFAFSVDRMKIEFSEVEEPLGEAEKDSVFQNRRQLGLTNTVDELKRRNSELKSDAEALKELLRNVTVETERVKMMQNLQQMNAHMGTSTGEQLPEENGENGLEAGNGTDRV
jgi:hypothetical protein